MLQNNRLFRAAIERDYFKLSFEDFRCEVDYKFDFHALGIILYLAFCTPTLLYESRGKFLLNDSLSRELTGGGRPIDHPVF